MFAIPSLGLHFYICSEWSYPCPWWQVSPLSVAAIVALILSISSSWYPKKTDVENGPDSGLTPPQSIMGYPSSSSLFGTGVAPHRSRLEDRHTSHQLEVAKTMVMDLPQPRSPAHSLAAHTPSPKPSPGRAKSSLVRSRKANSSSPADRDGFYPCNRCGRYAVLHYLHTYVQSLHFIRIRDCMHELIEFLTTHVTISLLYCRVFTKVKSRSAHMKSHIVKQS